MTTQQLAAILAPYRVNGTVPTSTYGSLRVARLQRVLAPYGR